MLAGDSVGQFKVVYVERNGCTFLSVAMATWNDSLPVVAEQMCVNVG